MFKPVLDALDKVEQNGLSERIDSHPATKKYWLTLGGSIVLLTGTIFINVVTLIKRKDIQPAVTSSVIMKDGHVDVNSVKRIPVTLPAAHQTFKNITSWLTDAISETYTFSFTNFYQQADKAEQYFTPEGYKSYVNALKMNNVEKDIMNKKLEVAAIPLQTPVLINGGSYGNNEFWRFRVPILVSVQGGKDPVVDHYMMEVLILRVPSYVNHKGIAIAEYNMKKL
jgi:hypothetical protein